MTIKTATSVPILFWALSALALVWNGMGVVNFFMQMNSEMLASMPESHRALIDTRPLWATAGFGISVVCGALGAVMLLLRKSSAYSLFVISLIAMVAPFIAAFGPLRSTVEFTPVEYLLAVILPPVVAIFLVWYAERSRAKGWIS